MKKTIFLFLVVFFIGYGIAASTKPEPKTVVETKEVVKEVKMDDTNWRSLKSIDDNIMTTAGAGFGACSSTVRAAASLDSEGIAAGTEEMKQVTQRMEVLASQRLDILEKLGY